MTITTEVPNRNYIEMTFVKETATGKGLNTQFIMENIGDGTFSVTDGRVGIKVGPHKPKRYLRPMDDWDKMFLSRMSRGYLVTKTKKMDKKIIQQGGSYKEIPDPAVKEIVERLMSYADQAMEENFTVKVDDISDEMIDYGKEILGEMQSRYQKMSVAEFNSKLKVLYAAVPRRIDKLSDKLAKYKSDFLPIIEEEQELYDLMIKQVRAAGLTATDDKTILDLYGLHIRPVTADEEQYIKKKLTGQASSYKNAWKVTFDKSEAEFNDFCKKENLTFENDGISHLFHGSKHQCWWSILTNGIWCEPEKHPEFCGTITGKAYGLGAYMAADAIKSKGYTSFMNSKWAHGTEDTGFMALFKAATGDPSRRFNGDRSKCSNNDSSTLTWDNLQKVQPGALCTWAECRYSGFMMDEIIMYQEKQFTIDYLIELGA